MKKILFLCALLFATDLCAQPDLTKLREAYINNKRDISTVKEYTDALINVKQIPHADSVLKEYMSRCPVIQFTDKDTYLLLNHLLFKDPYNNEFEYGIYAYRKLSWEREETPKDADPRKEALRSIFKGFGSSVSKKDEIDKRFEAYTILTKTLSAEVDKQCVPKRENNKNIMPPFDEKKVNTLQELAQKLNDETSLLKITVAKAVAVKDYTKAIHALNLFRSMGIVSLEKGYYNDLLMAISDDINNRELVMEVLDATEKTDENSLLLSKYYRLSGDTANAEKYKMIYDREEAERNARFGDLLKSVGK